MPVSPDLTLQPHQQVERDQAAAAAAAGDPYRRLLVWQVGTGKTIGALAAADALGGPAAVVAPAAVRPAFRAESQRVLGHQLPVVSYQQAAAGRAPPADTLVVDEAQRLTSPASTQARAVADQARAARNVILLSGTPVRNAPSELAPLVSILTNQPLSADEFNARFVGTERHRPGGLLGWLRGEPAVDRPVLKHTEDLKALLRGKVDYYENATPPPGAPASVRTEDVESELTPAQARLYEGMWGRIPFLTRWKLKWDYPLTDAELARTRAFLTGPRQVALSDLPYRRDRDPLRAFENSGKLTAAFSRLKARLGDPRAKAIVYSNYLEAGLRPYAAALAKEKIPHAVFHGGLTDEERRALVDDFNAGRLRAALVAPAGAEGISLKGSQLIQLLDPHWNEARMRQAQARGIRYDSHLGLPEDLRGVTVERYVARLPLGLRGRLLAALGVDRDAQRATVDDYLRAMSTRKERLNTQLMDLIKEVSAENRGKAAADRVALADAVTAAAAWADALDPGDRFITGELAGLVPGLTKPAGVAVGPVPCTPLPAAGPPAPPLGRGTDPGPGIAVGPPDVPPPPPPAVMDASGPDALAKAAVDYALGIPDRTDRGDHTRLPVNQLVDFFVQRHLARRAGEHQDVRLGTPETGLFSWATRKALPGPGGRPIALFRQPLHEHAYGGWSGTIPAGAYGAGTVKAETKGRALVTKVTPDAVSFTLAHTGDPVRYTLRKTDGKWLLVNTTPTEPLAHAKVHYKSVPAAQAEAVLENLQPGSSVQAKVDGSAALTELLKDRYETHSYRAQKGCFSPTAPVYLADGSSRPISEVVAGDEVATPDGPAKVIAVHNNGVGDDWYGVRTTDSYFEVTPGHCLLVAEVGWVPVAVLAELPAPIRMIEGVICVGDQELQLLRSAIFSQSETAEILQPTVRGIGELVVAGSSQNPGADRGAEAQYQRIGSGTLGKAETATISTTGQRRLATAAAPRGRFDAQGNRGDHRLQPLGRGPGDETSRYSGTTGSDRTTSPPLEGWDEYKKSEILLHPETDLGRGAASSFGRDGQPLRVLQHPATAEESSSTPSDTQSLLEEQQLGESDAALYQLPQSLRRDVRRFGENILRIERLPRYERSRHDLTIDHPEHWYIVGGVVVHNSNMPILHSERLAGGRPSTAGPVPPDLVGTVLRGELYGEHGGRAIPPQELGGLLNASVGRSLDAQRERGIALKHLVFDINRLGKTPVTTATPYPERLRMIRDVLARGGLPADKFIPPEEATTPAAAVDLWRRVREGEYPLTGEGVVIHPPTGVPVKVKGTEEFDVYPTRVFPGRGKYEGNAAGGFAYSRTPGGPEVGEVGTGFSDETRRTLHAAPQDFLGRAARVRAQQAFPSGALRAPSFLAWHEDYPAAKAAAGEGADDDDSPPAGPAAAADDGRRAGGPGAGAARLRPGLRQPVPGGVPGQPGAVVAAQQPAPAGGQPQSGPPADAEFRLAKAYSDAGNYAAKTVLLRDLVRRDPAAWRVDSWLNPAYVGVTHAPSGWRYHLPAAAVTDLLPLPATPG